MPGFTGDRPFENRAELGEERGCDLGIERQFGRELDQDGSKPVSELARLFHEAAQRLGGVEQPPFMGDAAWQLDGKEKAVGHRLGPADESLRPVRAMKGRVDLGSVEARGIALQAASLFRNLARRSARDRPSGSPDPDHARKPIVA